MKKNYKIQIKPYKPFNNGKIYKDFLSVVKNNKVIELINKKLDYRLIFEKNPPKTGILLANYINKFNFNNFKILDVGTGCSAILAIHLAKLGGKKIFAIDNNWDIIKNAQLNIIINRLEKKIIAQKISVFNYKPLHKFDLIISNPPQMPVPEYLSQHDDGGKDGRLFINKIISLGNKILRKNGKLIFTVFDFLGVIKSFNKNSLPICTLLKNNNFKINYLDVLIEKKISKKSYTYKNISYIKKIYPYYKFKELKHKIYVVYATKI